MRLAILDEGFVHYVLTIFAAALLCSLPSTILGLPTAFSRKFLLVVIPVSLFVGAFNATTSLAKSENGGVSARLVRLILGYCLVLAAIFLLGSGVAFYVAFFRAMLVWQMMAALAASTAAVMTWRFFDGATSKSSRTIFAAVAFILVMGLAIALFRHFASEGWQITGVFKL